ncbi:eukaryotic porin/Tom40 [Polychytrium aggregatum]|uniref:eukaryotic porin/Tom40 n=1 Tax=Polychytrium aggregatum TaxID=110093 RepID=UPI0022FDD934|nr:eukaryotic porin/Tom40 [Polychytrium aggregatum]KAI9202719.1 eukaryotic porin/Tom40 [Polychytrium aggregatum]
MVFVPPSYSNIGKETNDLLGKDFPAGNVKLEFNSTASNGLKFTVTGSNNAGKTGGIIADIKSKFSDKARGFTFTESWTTANVLGVQLELQDNIAKGLKLDVNASILPAIGSKSVKAGAEYKQEYIFTRANIDLFRGPTIAGDVVVGNDGYIVGGDIAYDVNDAKVTRYNGAVGYANKEYSVTLHATNAFNTFAASYFHRLNPEVEAGARAVWNKSSDANVTIELGSKYTLDKEAFAKAKIDNHGRLGLSYTQNLRPGLKVTFGGIFDTSRLQENAHKVGLSFVVDA